MNQEIFYRLLTSHPGQTKQSSSFGKDPDRGGTWWGFRPPEARIKRIMLKPGEVHTMAAPDGPGMITRINMTTLLPFNIAALRSLVLRFYWDGEQHPSVECPFGDFFGAPFGTYHPYISVPMSLTSGAYNCLWLMPFQEGARLEVANEGDTTIEPFFYNITYVELDSSPSDLRFHASWHRENPTRPGKPYTILDAEGRGHYIGCHLNMQNLEWWLRPPIREIAFPRGFGLGMMEGWESLYIDGEAQPSVIGTGTEDYFNGAWYYLVKGGTFSAPYHGCIVRDLIRGRIAVYRFDMAAPVSFSRSLKVNIDHGFRNDSTSDYSSTAYWYQEEPHRPFHPLPQSQYRKPKKPLSNIAQAALLVGPPAIFGLSLFWRLIRRR
jgi:hypothetical protein